MITIQLPTSGPLYEALWRFRKRDESVPSAALRAISERVLERRVARPQPDKPLLSFVEVLP